MGDGGRAIAEGDAHAGLARPQAEHPPGAGIQDLHIHVLADDAQFLQSSEDGLIHRAPARFDVRHFLLLPLGRCDNTTSGGACGSTVGRRCTR